MWRVALVALTVSLTAPALADPVPKPQTFFVLARAKTSPPATLDPVARRLLERADAAIVAATKAYEDAVDAYAAALEANPESLPPEPQPDFTEARSLLDEALLKLGPRAEGREVALYLAGWLASEEHRDQDAITLFGELATRYPKSEYAPEAAFRLGDLHFFVGDLEAAAQAYRQVTSARRGRLYAAGAYKLAWTRYRQDQLDVAYRELDRLATYIDAHPEDANAVSLRPEVIEYLAVILAEPDAEGDAWSRITARLDGSRVHHAEVAERAAKVYRAMGDAKLADQVDALANSLATPAKPPAP